MSPSYRFNDLRSPEFKSVSTAVNQDLIVAGWAALYDVDREHEAFEDGAFEASIDDFMQGNRQVLFHHDLRAQVGQVMEAKIVAGKGLWAKSRIFHQPEGSPLRHVYENVRRGVCNGYSVGGYFHRRDTPNGPRIHRCDIVELSITGSPVGKRSTFTLSEIAGKALADNGEQAAEFAKAAALAELRRDVEATVRGVELDNVQSEIRRLEHERDNVRRDAVLERAAADRRRVTATYGAKAQSATSAPGVVGGASGVGMVAERQPRSELEKMARQQAWQEHSARVNARFEKACADARTKGEPEPIRLAEMPFTVPHWWEADGATQNAVTITETRPPTGDENGVLFAANVHPVTGMPFLSDISETDLSPEEHFRLLEVPEAERPGLMRRMLGKVGVPTRRPAPEFPAPTTVKYRRDARPADWDEDSPEAGAHESPNAYFARLSRINAARAADKETT